MFRSRYDAYFAMNEIDNNMRILKEKNRELIALTEGIKRHSSNTQVSELVERVETVNDEVSGIVRTHQQMNELIPRKFEKLIIKMMKKIDTILNKIRKLRYELLARQVPVPLHGKVTVEKNMDAILECLRDPLIHKIGIYGIGGSGKTATMTNISNQLARTKDFDKIIWFIVSEDCSLKTFQEEIAPQLDQNLEKAYKFLIVIDDLRDPISLSELGIPEPNEENKCKIVMITHLLPVCRAMGTDKNIKLNILSKEDAWEVFIGELDNDVPSPEVQSLAKQLVLECDGIPMAINIISRAMRHQVDIDVWKQMLELLINSPREIKGMESVFYSFEDIYNHMKYNDTLRKCFLYLAMFPKDYEIEATELVRYWIADGCINVKEQLEREINVGFDIVRDLINTCMFEECSNYATICIRMHSLTRCFASNILEHEDDILIKAGSGLTQSPSINEWEKPRKISLMRNMIEVLGNQPNCPNLSALILRENPLSQNIFSSFFTHFPALKLLDLSHTGISKLPSSLSELFNLHVLYLQECTSLEKIPSLSKLEKLQELNLFHTAIKELPPGTEKLVSLRSLDLSFTYQLENLVIPNLSLLEEFCTEGSKFWCVDSTRVVKYVMEILSMDCLEILSLSFVRLDDYLDAFMFIKWEMLKNFRIRLSHPLDMSYMDYQKYGKKSVYICNQEICTHSSILLPPNTRELNITLCNIPRLSELLCLRNAWFLRKCHIERCSLLSGDCLITGDEMEEQTLTDLKILSLKNIRGLTTLWAGSVHYPCFENLQMLDVQWCGCLKTVIFVNVLDHLKNIEVIKVKECKLLEEIVKAPYGEGNEDDCPNTGSTSLTQGIVEVPYAEGRKGDITTATTIHLPALHTFILQALPQLHTISRITWACPLLRHVEVFKCPRLKKVPFRVASLPRLKTLKGERGWWEALEWHDAETKSFLQSRLEPREQISYT